MPSPISAEDIIIIDFIENEYMNRMMLKKIKKAQMKAVVFINVLCLNDQLKFSQIKKIVNNPNFFKFFYGGTKNNFQDMINRFGFQNETDAAATYIGAKFKIDEDVIRPYWNWRLSFRQFLPLLSLKGEEI